MSNRAAAGTGGGGAGYHAKIIITEGGYYNVVVGSGGGSRGAAGNQSATDTTAGAASTFSIKDGETLISAGGGGRGTSNQSSGSAGGGGTLTKSANLNELEVFVSRNGYNGSARNSAGDLGRTSGPISGHNWGSAAEAGCGYNSSSTGYSKHGYFSIKYVGPAPNMYEFTINPTPSDATVTLTVNGTTYNQNYISVASGTTVSWSVSKSGYETQTGTNVITEDTTESVVLEEQAIPLYYCYRMNLSPYGYFYYYMQTTNYNNNTPVYSTSSASQATSSSQLQYNNTVSGLSSFGTFERYAAGDLYT